MDISLTSKSFNDLPNEIVEEIFDYFSTKVILSNREVCKKWQEHGALICRRRNLHLTTKFYRQPDKFFSEVSATGSLPWSSFDLRINSISFLTNDPDIMGTLSKIQIQKFIQYFGNQVKQLKLTADEYGSVLDLLKGTPNIEKLNLSVESEYNKEGNKKLIECWIQNEDETFQLKKLKIFKTEVQKPNAGKLLEAIIIHSPVLKYVEITSPPSPEVPFHDYEEKIRFHEIFGNLCNKNNLNMPAFGLELTYSKYSINECKFLNDNNIKVTKLKLQIYLPDKEDKHFFEQLERLFLINWNTLEELDLTCEEWLPCHSTKLQVPDLQALSYLKLFHSGDERRGKHPLPFLQPFVSTQFQNLRSFVIYTNQNISFLRSCQLNSVRSLSLCDEADLCAPLPWVRAPQSMSTEDWARVFPNITELKVTADAVGVRYIFEKMQQLIKLELAVNLNYGTRNRDGGNIENSNMNSLLCGNTINDQNEGEVITTSVSILSLKELKILDLCIRNCNRQQTLTDVGIDNSLILMQPLERLTLNGVHMISEECKAKLKSHHGKVYIDSSDSHQRFIERMMARN